MGNSGLARTLIIYMITVPVFAVLAALTIFGVTCIGGIAAANVASSSSSASSGGSVMGGWFILVLIVELLIMLIELALYIWYIVLLYQTRGSITRRLAA
jgi:hypothetical protein